MISSSVYMLLEQAIDTPEKLHCVILFAQRTVNQGTAAHIARQLGRDIWSIERALKELSEAGILSVAGEGKSSCYHYQPRAYVVNALELLLQTYNDPILRSEVCDYVRELASYAPYRAHFHTVLTI